jgi:16S rRNA processing protein RimM
VSQTRILLGRIGRAQGLKGEVRLTSFTQDPVAIAGYGPLENADGTRRFVITEIALRKDVLVARLEGVTDRTGAEALVHQELWVARERIDAATDEDEFLHADLIGCMAVSDTGAALGTVVDLPNYGAGDLIELALEGRAKTVLLPFTKAFVPVVDVPARRVSVVLPEGFLDEAQPERGEDAAQD